MKWVSIDEARKFPIGSRYVYRRTTNGYTDGTGLVEKSYDFDHNIWKVGVYQFLRLDSLDTGEGGESLLGEAVGIIKKMYDAIADYDGAIGGENRLSSISLAIQGKSACSAATAFIAKVEGRGEGLAENEPAPNGKSWEDYIEGYSYLARLFKHYAPQCEPMDKLTSLASQIDNLLVSLRDAVPPPGRG